MKLRWTPLALGQVQEIAEHIAQDKPGAAERWADGIFDLVETLTVAPRRGRIVPEVGREQIREVFSGSYRIIYKLTEDAVSILSVRHGQRLLAADDLEEPTGPG